MIEILLTGDTVTIPVDCPPPVNRGSVTAGISTARGGPVVHPTLERELVWPRGGSVPPLRLYTKDLRALFPKGRVVHLVVRYAGALLHTREVRVVG